MFISVIICTYNRLHLLRRTLQSLSCQTVPNDRFEIIVVDDASLDNTGEVCRAMQGNVKNFKYVPLKENAGAAEARNRGLKVAEGDRILFTDDDCIPAADWVEKMNALLEQHEIVAGSILSQTTSYLRLCHNIAQFHAFMEGREAGYSKFATTANLGLRRNVLDQLDGFRPSLRVAQDTDLILRAQGEGFRVYFYPEAIVTHDPEETTLRAIFRYSIEHAAVTIHLRNEYRSILRTPFVLRSATLVLLTAPLIALKVTAGIYLKNSKLLKLLWTAPLVYILKLAWCWGAVRGLKKQKMIGAK